MYLMPSTGLLYKSDTEPNSSISQPLHRPGGTRTAGTSHSANDSPDRISIYDCLSCFLSYALGIKRDFLTQSHIERGIRETFIGVHIENAYKT